MSLDCRHSGATPPTMQGSMLTLGVAATLLTAGSALADYRRRNRTDLDRVGFMPWPLISVAAVMTALFAFAFALKGG
jgi:hypothetical protein